MDSPGDVTGIDLGESARERPYLSVLPHVSSPLDELDTRAVRPGHVKEGDLTVGKGHVPPRRGELQTLGRELVDLRVELDGAPADVIDRGALAGKVSPCVTNSQTLPG